MNKLYSIQMLRGLAAVAVVVDHVTHYMHKSFSGQSWLFSSNIYNVGGFGVDLFFCISGFIMVITTYNKPSGLSQSLSFLKKRFVRIYPTYWFYCILTLALPFILYGKTDLLSKYDSFFLLQSFLLLPAKISENSFSPFLGQGWTLQYELYFYLIFSLALLAFRGGRVIVSSSMLILILLISSKVIEMNKYIDYLVSNPIVIDFIMGMLSARIYIYLRKKNITVTSRVGVFALIIIISFVAYFVINKYSINRLVLFGIPSFLIITLFSLIDINIESLLKRCIVQIGEASYTIYLAHMALIWAALKHSHYIKWMNADIAITVNVLAICIVAYIMYLAVERNMTLMFHMKHKLKNAISEKDN